MFKKLLRWLADRANEKGTRSVLVGGLVWVAGTIGLDLGPDAQSLWDGLVASVTAIFVAAFKEKTVEH